MLVNTEIELSSFGGINGEVTGSKHQLRINDRYIFIDYGAWQSNQEDQQRNAIFACPVPYDQIETVTQVSFTELNEKAKVRKTANFSYLPNKLFLLRRNKMSKLTSEDLESLKKPVIIEKNQDLSELKEALGRQRLQFICDTCKKDIILSLICFQKHPFCCTKCARKNTILQKYGTENWLAFDAFKKSRKETMLKKFGVEYGGQSEELRKKSKDTREKRYGNPNYNNREKQIKTCLERYGVISTNSLDTVKEKQQAIKKERYENGNFDLNKRRQNCMQKYGVTCPNKLETVKEKQRQSKLDKYGSLKNYNNFCFDELIFDSSWELAFYIYWKDQNASIVREPTVLYYNVLGQKHRYYPDFSVNGQLYEIKGDQFLNERNELVTFLNNEQPGLLTAKQKCMQENNVKLITREDINFYVKYAKSKFGRNFKDKFLKKEC